MEQPDELDKYIDALFHEEFNRIIKDDIAPYTCQILKDTGEDVKPFASGVLAELGGSCYILTASHVVEDWPHVDRLFLRIDNSYISIAGKACGIEVKNEKRIDIAYIKLKEELALILKQFYRFLSIKRFLKHNKMLDEANYCTFGFPAANYKIEEGKLRTIGSAYFMRPLPDKVFHYYNLDFLSHYVLEFKGKGVSIKSGEVEKVNIEHYGLSGGGLWYIAINYDGKNFISNAHLIGIMSEFRKGKYECIISNRIEIVLSMLHEHEGLKLKEKKI